MLREYIMIIAMAFCIITFLAFMAGDLHPALGKIAGAEMDIVEKIWKIINRGNE
jgi:hypothetical protein